MFFIKFGPEASYNPTTASFSEIFTLIFDVYDDLKQVY